MICEKCEAGTLTFGEYTSPLVTYLCLACEILEHIGFVSTAIDWTIQDGNWSGDVNKLGIEEYWMTGLGDSYQ